MQTGLRSGIFLLFSALAVFLAVWIFAISPMLTLQRDIERLDASLQVLRESEEWLSEEIMGLRQELRLDEDIKNSIKRKVARKVLTGPNERILALLSTYDDNNSLTIGLARELGQRTITNRSIDLDVAEQGLGHALLCAFHHGVAEREPSPTSRYPNTELCEGSWSGEAAMDRTLISYAADMAEPARALADACQRHNALATFSPLSARPVGCREVDLSIRQEALEEAFYQNGNLEPRYRLLRRPLDDIGSPVMAVDLVPRWEIAICNSSPFPGSVWLLPAPNSDPNLITHHDLTPGSCQLVVTSYKEEEIKPVLAFHPVRESIGFLEAVKLKPRIGEVWSNSFFFRPPGYINVVSLCVDGGVTSLTERPSCPIEKQIELSPPVESFYSIGNNTTGTPRPIWRTNWEPYDPVSVETLPEQLLSQPTERSLHFAALGKSLEDRARDPDPTISNLIIGLQVCDDPVDDPFILGVLICEIDYFPPHEYPVPIKRGEVITHLAGVPIFSVKDVHRVLRRLDAAHNYDYSSVSVLLEVEVAEDPILRWALPYWNPATNSGCPEPNAFWIALLNSVTVGLAESISPNTYGRILRIKQFCPDEFQWGGVIGIFAGFSGRIAKIGTAALTREARKDVLWWLSSRTGQMVMQSLDEVIYAFSTAPKIQSTRETLSDAGVGVGLGLAVGIITGARPR